MHISYLMGILPVQFEEVFLLLCSLSATRLSLPFWFSQPVGCFEADTRMVQSMQAEWTEVSLLPKNKDLRTSICFGQILLTAMTVLLSNVSSVTFKKRLSLGYSAKKFSVISADWKVPSNRDKQCKFNYITYINGKLYQLLAQLSLPC